MLDSTSYSDRAPPAWPAMPQFVRTESEVRARFIRIGRETRLQSCFETGGLRARLPRSHGPCDCVLINTAGGMTGGDTASIDITAGHATRLHITTQSAEKIYRSDSGPASARVRLQLEDGARLAWIPQETILFDNARLSRSFDIAMTASATALVHEMTVFGRAAHGEHWTRGLFRDRWRVRRNGKLAFADDVLVPGDAASILDKAAAGGGARAFATLLLVAASAEQRLNAARDSLRPATSDCGASAWNGMLIVRFAAEHAQAVRSDVQRTLRCLLKDNLPRIWSA